MTPRCSFSAEDPKAKTVIINRCYGGAGFSKAAATLAIERGCKHISAEGCIDSKAPDTGSSSWRECPVLIQIVQDMTDDEGNSLASGDCAQLKLETDVWINYTIHEHDGYESFYD